MHLGVNVDHVATVRQARQGRPPRRRAWRSGRPDPARAAQCAIAGGADAIVAHLREDRRHIQDEDLRRLKRLSRPLNLEMSAAEPIVRAALRLRPWRATLVPERRAELTTEGGLDVLRHDRRLRSVIGRLRRRGIGVSLFVDPDVRQVRAAHASGAPWIELHTGGYANSRTAAGRRRQLRLLRRAARYGRRLGLRVAAGHGLDYDNVAAVAALRDVEELNIGHAIVGRAVCVGMASAVREMKQLMRTARRC